MVGFMDLADVVKHARRREALEFLIEHAYLGLERYKGTEDYKEFKERLDTSSDLLRGVLRASRKSRG